MTWKPTLVQPQTKRKRRNQPEAKMQESMVEYLDLALPDGCGVWWSATLNGIRLNTPQARARAKKQGLRKGLYDIIFIRTEGPFSGQTYHYEVKAPDGSLTPEQKALLAVLWPAGRGATGKTVENLSAALVAWGFPIRAYPS